MEEVYRHIDEMVQKGDAKAVERLVNEALAAGLPVRDILQKGLVEGITVISRKYRSNEVFVPQVLMSARAMGRGRLVLEPYFPEAEIKTIGTMVIGTVKGDLHDIGKNVVAMLFKGEGFNVVDLGVNVAAEDFVEAVAQNEACIVGLSALLTTTLSSLRDCVAAIKASGSRVKVMVGGAPVTESFARDIGSDAYAEDATTAVELGKRLAAEYLR